MRRRTRTTRRTPSNAVAPPAGVGTPQPQPPSGRAIARGLDARVFDPRRLARVLGVHRLRWEGDRQLPAKVEHLGAARSAAEAQTAAARAWGIGSRADRRA